MPAQAGTERRRWLHWIRWGVAASILLFGVLTRDPRTLKWMFFALLLHAVPLVGQCFRSTNVRVWSIWFGVLIVAQTLLSPVLIGDYRHLPPNLSMVLDVQGGIPGISGRQSYTTDEMGYRVTKPIDYQTEGGYRVFAIGASTTEQTYLDDRKTWTHLLQERMTAMGYADVEVINTGVSGVRARHHLATLRRVLSLHPDRVIVLLGINDWNWHIRGGAGTQPPWYEDLSYRFSASMLGRILDGLLARRRAESDRGPGEPIPENGEFYAARRGSLHRADRRVFRPTEVHPEYAASLVAIAELCKAEQIPCLFVTQPNAYDADAPDDIREALWMTPPDADFTLDFDSMVAIASLYNEHLVRFGREHGVAVCDVALSMPPTHEAFVDDCHFNEAGAAMVARAIADCVGVER